MEGTSQKFFSWQLLWIFGVMLVLYGCPQPPETAITNPIELNAPWEKISWYDSLDIVKPPLEEAKLFPFLKAKHVKVYSFNFGKPLAESQFRLIRGDDLTEELPLPDSGDFLNQAEANELLACLTPPYKSKPPKIDLVCFYYPRHGFIFFDDQGAPIGALEVCFECQEYRMYPNAWLTMYPDGFTQLEEMLQQKGLITREPTSQATVSQF